MVDAGVDARKMIVFIGPKRRQPLRWRRILPVTPAALRFFSFCPLPRPLCSVIDRCEACIIVADAVIAYPRYVAAGFSFSVFSRVRSTVVQAFFNHFKFKVTTPALLGAFFRKEVGRGISPPSQGRRKGTQGVSPPYVKERWPGTGVVPPAFQYRPGFTVKPWNG